MSEIEAHPPAAGTGGWKVTKNMKPGQRGAIKLTRRFGSDLLCVRYRESPDGRERLTTIELVLERVAIDKRKDAIVSFKIRHDEEALRQAAKARGARFDFKTKLWLLPRREVIRMGLRDRIAKSLEEIHEELVRRSRNW